MIPDFNRDCPNAVHLGFRLLQNRHAIPFWSYAIDLLKPAAIVEIGTWEGGFTCCLGIAARNTNSTVYTFGLEEVAPLSAAWFTRLPVLFFRGDVFSEQSGEVMAKIAATATGTILWLCDGGNKPKEFERCAALARPGDVVAAHDFPGPTWPWSEISEEQVAPVCSAFNLQPWLHEDGAHAGWLVKRKA